MVDRDRNCTQEEIADYQQMVSLVCAFCLGQEQELIERYLDQTRGQADGTMDAILPHFMNLHDMKRGKRKLNFLREVGKKILEVKKLYMAEIKAELDDKGNLELYG